MKYIRILLVHMRIVLLDNSLNIDELQHNSEKQYHLLLLVEHIQEHKLYVVNNLH